MERFTFDDAYVRRLREGDRETAEHFDAYFRELIRAKLRGRVPVDAIPDILQTTFVRVLEKLHDLRDGAKLGAFVFGICDNVTREHYRGEKRNLRTDAAPVPFEPAPIDAELITAESCSAVRATLGAMPGRDSDILRAVFLDEVPKDEVCRRFSVDRNYLRVLLHRAKEEFRKRFRGV